MLHKPTQYAYAYDAVMKAKECSRNIFLPCYASFAINMQNFHFQNFFLNTQYRHLKIGTSNYMFIFETCSLSPFHGSSVH